MAGAATTAGIRNPGIQAGFEQFNKIRGVKPTGLSDDVVDQLDDMLG